MTGSTFIPRNPPLPAGGGSDRLLFIDAFSGVSGDMLVSALVDLGVPESAIEAALQPLPLKGYRTSFSSIQRSGIAATRFEVRLDEPQPARDWSTIRAMLQGAEHLPKGAQRLALDGFERLARAEAEVHGTRPEQVHFHEVGAVDSIVDAVAAAVAIDHVGARVVCSPLPIGRGLVETRHGALPLPAPATVLCLRGLPTCDAGIDAELVTPTGASLVAAAASDFSRWPAMACERVGWGAGSRELEDRPNLLRVILGSASGLLNGGTADAGQTGASHIVLEANLDDISGEIAALALQRALQAGALDAWTTPIGMKKGRPGLMLSALARAADAETVARALLSETTTLGLRLREVRRIERPRRSFEVETIYGNISIKIADGDGLPPNLAPEYEQCRRAAEAHRVPVKQVMQAALLAAALATDL